MIRSARPILEGMPVLSFQESGCAFPSAWAVCGGIVPRSDAVADLRLSWLGWACAVCPSTTPEVLVLLGSLGSSICQWLFCVL